MVAGCSKADVQPLCEDQTVTVSYCIQTPLTKAMGDGSKADYVWYALYRFQDDSFVMECEHIQPFTDGKALCPVKMTIDQSYKVLFVAQHYEADAAGKTPTYPIDAPDATVSMPVNAVAGSENYDIFAAVDTVMHFNGSAPKSVSLKRIVSMVNFFSTEDAWNSLVQKPAYCSLSISGVPAQYNLLSGTPSNRKVTVSYQMAPIVSETDRFLASAYCLPSGSSVDATLDFYADSQSPYYYSQIITSIPLERNKKTQVTGNIIN